MKNKDEDSKSKDSKLKSTTISMRADKALEERIKAVAIKDRRTPAAVIAICVEDHLPVLEIKLGLR